MRTWPAAAPGHRFGSIEDGESDFRRRGGVAQGGVTACSEAMRAACRSDSPRAARLRLGQRRQLAMQPHM